MNTSIAGHVKDTSDEMFHNEFLETFGKLYTNVKNAVVPAFRSVNLNALKLR